MLIWMQERDLFLQEFLRLEAPEDEQTRCSTSECPSTALFRCSQCTDTRLFCQNCIVCRHQVSPFHVIEVRTFLHCCCSRSHRSVRNGTLSFSNGAHCSRLGFQFSLGIAWVSYALILLVPMRKASPLSHLTALSLSHSAFVTVARQPLVQPSFSVPASFRLPL